MQHKKFHVTPLPAGAETIRLQSAIATWFGIGRLRPAPGTLGTLGAIPFGYAIMWAGGPVALGLSALALLGIGTWAAAAYARKSGQKDDQCIVVDEVIGLWIAAIPAGLTPWLWGLAFLLFRFFDIYKPWPASYFDRRQKYEIDVLLDDVIAGLFAMTGVALAAVQHMILGS